MSRASRLRSRRPAARRQHRQSLHFRYNLARRRAVPRRHHDLRGEAGGRRLPRRHGRRHHRGGLPDRLRRRLPGRPRDRQALEELGGVRAVARRRGRHRPRRRGREARRTPARPHLHLHLARAQEAQADEDRRSRCWRWCTSRSRARATGWRTWSGARRTRPAPRSTISCRCVETAIKAGASTINLPDTVGYATPEEYYQMFRTIMEKVPGSEKVIFSVHCHNDLGMAVANSLAGIRAGCRQVECTINGIGERAGNAALEEIVMAIKTRGDVLPYQVGIDATMLNRASKLVAAATSFPVQYNKAIVGPQRVRARERHPPGRHAQAHADLRDHDAGVGRRVQDLAGDGQALGPRRLPRQAEGARLRAGRERARGRLQSLQGAGRPQEARLRRGHRGAGGRGDRHRAGPRQGGGAAGDRRHHGAAVGDAHPGHGRRPAGDGACDRQRPGGCDLQRHRTSWCRTRPGSRSTRCTR